MSTSKIQITEMINPPNTMKALDALAKEKAPLDTGKPTYVRLADKLQENFEVTFMIVVKT